VEYYRVQLELLKGERMYRLMAYQNLRWLGQTLIRCYKIAERHNLERDFLKDFIAKLSKHVCELKKTF
jgi:DNA-binding IscR family transcriptional regulator